MQSKLPRETLGRVWQMSDINQDGIIIIVKKKKLKMMIFKIF